MNDIENSLDILTAEQVGKMLGISRVTLWKWVNQNILRQHKIGRRCYFFKTEIIEDIQAHEK